MLGLRHSTHERAKILPAVEGEEVRVVVVVGTAESIVPGRAAHGDEVVTVEKPIDVLKPVLSGVGMVQEDCASFPSTKIRAANQGEGIADAGWFGTGI